LALVLAVEPDHRQATILKRIIRDQVRADLVLVDSRDAAVAALTARIPDVILLTALLSPRDEEELVAYLRTLAGAQHIQTHTIPQLASTAADLEQKGGGGLFGKLLGKKEPAPRVTMGGCDPDLFADEIRTFIEAASERKSESVEALHQRVAHLEFQAQPSQPSRSFSDLDPVVRVSEAAPRPDPVAEEPAGSGSGSAWESPFEWRPSTALANAAAASATPSLVTNVPLAVLAEDQEEQDRLAQEAQRAREEAEARRRREEEGEAERRRAEQAAAERVAAEARAREQAEREAEAARKAKAEKKRAAEAEAQRKREAEAVAKRKKEEEAEAERKRLEADARRKREAEAAAKKKQDEAEAKRKRELEAEAQRKRQEEEVRKRLEAEVKRKRDEAEAKRKREEEERRRLEAEAKRKREEEEERKRLEAEAKRKREEEERKRLEAEAKRKREEEERKRLEAEAKRKREEEERKRLEAEAKRKREEEERKRLEAEARRKREEAELERQRQAEAQLERQAQAEAELERQAIERKRHDEDARRREETIAARDRHAEQEELAWRRHEGLAGIHADRYAEFRAEHDEPKGLLRLMPLSVWARPENGGANGGTAPAQDDLHRLIEGLRMPPTVAVVSYPRGCRIRRVRVRAPKPTAAGGEKRRPVIVSRRALRGSRDDATP
jgi:hypothetical protein